MYQSNLISKLLRGSGIVAIIMAVINFLVGGHYNLNGTDASYIFILLNLLFCGLGIWSAKKLEHPITARTFIASSLALIPTQFAHMGGIVFDSYNKIPIAQSNLIPMDLNNIFNLSVLVVIVALLLFPIAYLGFSTLYRNSQSVLTAIYIFVSGLLLLPFRENTMSALLVGIMIGVSVVKLRRLPSLRTFESAIAKTVFVIPVVITIARQTFYGYSDSFLMFAMGILALVINFLAKQKISDPTTASMVQTVSVIPAFVSLSLGMDVFSVDWSTWFLLLSTMLITMSLNSPTGGKYYRNVSVFPMFIMTLITSTHSSTLQIAAALVWMIGAVTIAIYKLEKSFLISVLLNFVMLFIVLASKLIKLPQLGAWQGLICGGIVLIIIAGLYDKYFDSFKAKTSNFYKTLQ